MSADGGVWDADPAESSSSPYVGPRPYSEADHDVFFGREREAAEICSLWLAARVVVLYGPAGVGKTSLLHAGVLTRVAELGMDVDLLPVGRIIYQSAHPRAADPATYTYMLMSSWASSDSIPAEHASIADVLRGRPQRRNKYGDPVPVLGAIDHFEELYTAYPARAAERDDVIAQLSNALDSEPALRLLLVVRDDHLGDLAADERRLLPYPTTRVRLNPLTPEAARDAVTGPAMVRGREVAQADVSRLVDDLRTVRYVDRLYNSVDIIHEYVEPMSLQIVCGRAWSRLADAGEQSLAANVEPRNFDIDAALREFYADVVRKVARAHRIDERQLHDWLASAFITERGTRAISYRGIVMTDGISNEIADDLVRHGILTSEERVLGTWFQLSQGRLVRVVQEAGARRSVSGRGAPPPEPQPLDYRAAAVDAMARGDFTDAARLAAEAVEQFRSPDDRWKRADTLALLGSVARANGDMLQSTEYYQDAVTDFISIDDSRSVVRLYVTLAEMHFLAHDFANAVHFSGQALMHASRDPDALIASGYALWYAGHPPEALAEFNRALGTDASAALALSGRGQIEAEMEVGSALPKLRESTLADLDRALDIGLPSPVEEADTRSGRALALANRDQAEAAQDELVAALATLPARSQTLLRAALVSERTADISGARNLLGQATSALPLLSPWHLKLASRLAARLSRPDSQSEPLRD